MDLKLQKFVNTGKRFEDRITVTRSRSIGLPTQFYKDNNIRNYKYGILFFDPEKIVIGVKFSNNEDEQGKITITHSKEYGGHLLANSFFKSNRINTKRYSGRYRYTKKSAKSLGFDEDGVIFLVELKDNNKETTNEESG